MELDLLSVREQQSINSFDAQAIVDSEEKGEGRTESVDEKINP